MADNDNNSTVQSSTNRNEFMNIPLLSTPDRLSKQQQDLQQDQYDSDNNNLKNEHHHQNLKRSPSTPLTPSVGRQNIIKRRVDIVKGGLLGVDDPILESLNKTQTSVIQIPEATKTNFSHNNKTTTNNIYRTSENEERYMFDATPSSKLTSHDYQMEHSKNIHEIFNNTTIIVPGKVRQPDSAISQEGQINESSIINQTPLLSSAGNTQHDLIPSSKSKNEIILEVDQAKQRWIKDRLIDRMKDTIEFLELEREFEHELKDL